MYSIQLKITNYVKKQINVTQEISQSKNLELTQTLELTDRT